MTEKRFKEVYPDIIRSNYNFTDNGKGISDKEVVDLLNELHEENQSIKKHIEELYEKTKIDVDNGIEVYPKTLLEYILNILKIIGDVE